MEPLISGWVWYMARGEAGEYVQCLGEVAEEIPAHNRLRDTKFGLRVPDLQS